MVLADGGVDARQRRAWASASIGEAAAQELEAAQFALGCALRDGGLFGGGEADQLLQGSFAPAITPDSQMLARIPHFSLGGRTRSPPSQADPPPRCSPPSMGWPWRPARP